MKKKNLACDFKDKSKENEYYEEIAQEFRDEEAKERFVKKKKIRFTRGKRSIK